MTTYKTHDPARQATSLYFQQGLKDGVDDSYRSSCCPPIPPLGPDPDCSWSWLYMAGYERGYMPSPCSGCRNCKPEEYQ